MRNYVLKQKVIEIVSYYPVQAWALSKHDRNNKELFITPLRSSSFLEFCRRSLSDLHQIMGLCGNNDWDRIILALISDSAKPVFGDVGSEPSCETPTRSLTAQHAALLLCSLQSQRELFEILFEFKVFSTRSALIILPVFIITLRCPIFCSIDCTSILSSSLHLWALLLLFLVLPPLLLFLLRFISALFVLTLVS